MTSAGAKLALKARGGRLAHPPWSAIRSRSMAIDTVSGSRIHLTTCHCRRVETVSRTTREAQNPCPRVELAGLLQNETIFAVVDLRGHTLRFTEAWRCASE